MEFTTISVLDILFVVGSLIYAIYLYGTWTFSKFDKSKVPYLKPAPIFGNMLKNVLGREHLYYSFGRVYNSFPDRRYVGLFQTRIPMLMIRDPELIKQVAIKDFDHFVDHRSFLNEKLDPLFGNNLFSLKGQKWRDMRVTLSPAFTGSKMRAMYSLVSECAQQMADHLLKKPTNELQNMDIKKLFTLYTIDVIASAAFGVKVDTLANPDNEFYRMAKKVSNFSGFKTTLKFFGFTIMPGLMELLRIKFISDDCSVFFRKLVHGTMSMREKEGIVRPDMIHLLMQARQGTLQHDNTNTTPTQQQDAGFATVTESDIGKAEAKKRVWSDDDLTAQAVVFFFAGFETASTMLGFSAHELAVNPDVQLKLQQEIDEVREELGDRAPDYEKINHMKYLDMVVTETLRMWPPAGFMDRVCVKPYVMKDEEGNLHQVEKNDNIMFPIYSLHHDEKYFENPSMFDPERFSEENKKNIKPFTYIPFGVGPRNCIGSRFALMEIKAILFHILSHFSFEPCTKTSIPLELTNISLAVEPKNGFWLSMVPRSTTKL